MRHPELHIISDERNMEGFIAASARIHPLADYLHLRHKQASAKELAVLAERLLQAGVPPSKIIINDRVDVALCIGAAGVQLAWHSLGPQQVKSRWPGLRVGCSVHSPAEAVRAFSEGADYVLFGHVYETSSKPGLPARGLEQLAETARACSGPVIALGGIAPGHVPELIVHGAAGYAVLSGICAAPDPVAAAHAYRLREDSGMDKGGDAT